MNLYTTQEPRFESVGRYLAWDHDALAKILRDFLRMVEDEERERAEHTFDEYRARLLRHMRIEEEVLFPMFEAHIAAPTRGPTFVMRLEHLEIARLLEDLGEDLATWRPQRLLRNLDELDQVLAAHDVREEEILSPWIDRMAGSEVASLVSRLQRVR